MKYILRALGTCTAAGFRYVACSLFKKHDWRTYANMPPMRTQSCSKCGAVRTIRIEE